jgi:hypothetical protein
MVAREEKMDGWMQERRGNGGTGKVVGERKGKDKERIKSKSIWMGWEPPDQTDALSLDPRSVRPFALQHLEKICHFAIQHETKKSTKISTLGSISLRWSVWLFRASHSSGKRGIGRLGLIDRTDAMENPGRV